MEILAPIRGTIGSLPRLGRQEVVRPGRTEGYWDMAGSNRSQDILPHSACGSPTAGGTPSVVHARAIAAAADGGPGRFQSQIPSGDCLKPTSPKIAAAPSYGRDSAPTLVTSCGGSSAPEETMQPNNDPVGELKTNGPSPTAVPAEMPDSRVNGGASPELLDLLNALQSIGVGDFSVRMSGSQVGLLGKIADTFNEIVAANERMAQQLERVGQVVGREGKTRQRVKFDLSHGAWGEMETSVNTLIDDLLWPTTEVTRAISAVAQGDLLQTVRLDVDGRPLQGEFLRSATIVNTMIKQLSVFTSEVTRVAREVGTEGKLGGQAQVREVTGVWKDLTENVNSMASNLTAQVRNIADVTIAVAMGDLSKKITVDVRGEILQLKEAINTMVDQLRSFASEVTRVAREVGTEGKLGGQAIVPGVAGTWKDLTDSVNAMCGNLTDQVRNIAQVTTAVARGDLSRKITVDVRGEILELKDTFNT